MSTTTEYKIDASGRTIGRVASEAAKALMGKTRADYTPHILSDVKVVIENAGKLRISERKRGSQTYQRYSGYPGGQKVETLGMLMARKGTGAALRLAISRMLPRNRMKTARLKNLTVTE